MQSKESNPKAINRFEGRAKARRSTRVTPSRRRASSVTPASDVHHGRRTTRRRNRWMKRMTRRHQGSLRWPNVSRYDERHQGGGTPAPPVPHLLEPPSPQHAGIISIYLYMYIFVFNLQALLGAFNRRQTTRRHTRRENIKTQAVVSFPIKMNGNVIICSSVIKTLNFFKRFFNPSKQKTHRTVLYVKLLLPPATEKRSVSWWWWIWH